MERQQSDQILELLVETEQQQDHQVSTPPKSINGIHRGLLSEIDPASGLIRIVIPNLFGMEAVSARSIVPLSKEKLGEEVLVAFEAGDPRSPYIIGSLWQAEWAPTVSQPPIEAKVDGEQVVIEGKREIVLKCGKASITLTRAGKVLIRGAYVLSRSSGVNRLKGGSVQIN
ncbi:DUF6484 domain-containing protein [Nitrospira sp. BLG_2]|uniref:DUF6484 domain-containing protein n=1 Tax=Nitrospira sp. BLG_2 TaxID=3397507 RepID=UPI003B9977E2